MATSAAATDCRPFTAGLWLLWIGAAAINEALLDGVASLVDSEGPVGVPLLLLLAPVAVTLEWLVLRAPYRDCAGARGFLRMLVVGS